MNRYSRRILLGIVAGGIASAALIYTVPHPLVGVLLAAFVGAAYSMSMSPTQDAYVDNMMTASALGVPLWALISVVAIPLMAGRVPDWSAEQMSTHFPALVGWVLYGALLGLFTQGFNDLAERILGPEPARASSPPKEVKRILILGGGFAGMKTAESLEHEFQHDRSVGITLISETNSLLFTPMLAEVAGSSLEPSHISTPLRSSLPRANFIRATVETIDLEKRIVKLAVDPSRKDQGRREIPYDQLVLALGAISNYLGMANVQKYALDFKSLLDAIRVRNRVIEMFERADAETNPELRQRLLTFVIAGGGFAGVELAGALNDFGRGILADYPNLRPENLNVILVHSREHILPELSASLGRYAQEKMADRGVIFRLNARLKDFQSGVVSLSDGEIAAETLVWTAGTAPNPLLRTLPIELDKRGAVIVETTLAVKDHPGVWALGDCAAVTDGVTGKPCPPTAQFALREAPVLAKNVHAFWEGRALRPFHFDSLGSLCVVGHQTACAELSVPFARAKSIRFSGLLAWAMWRGIYLAKLPGLERKIRVLMDWTVELFFPRDIVQTIDLK
ncbi:MAG: NAD(P)/FAD-dependent oxidoreductase [Candidatus Acidiferrales bacterium]